jgi:aminoglycoside phosphotransferase (APT) family kinase protein
MELRIISGQPFVVVRTGKKEMSTPPATFIAQASSRIADANALLASLAQAQAIQQAAIETALLAGQPTAPASSAKQMQRPSRHFANLFLTF